MSDEIRGRFAPSPSGRMHIGNVFCALISWLSVKAEGGTAVLRIEDLDTARCRAEYTDQLLDDLRFLGLEYDEGPESEGRYGPYIQSKRYEYYEDILECLRKKELIFPCYCSRDELHAPNAPHASDGRVLYSGACRDLTEEQRNAKTRSPSYRIRSDETRYTFTDGVYGTHSFCVKEEWGDFIVKRSDGLFAYQLAVVADDAAMNISQVVRGRDLLTSVAPQLQLYNALGFEPPHFYHVPLLLNEEGRRLSKRDKDLDMGQIRARYSSGEKLIGNLLHLCGVLEKAEPISAKEAVSVFSWKRMTKEDIILIDQQI